MVGEFEVSCTVVSVTGDWSVVSWCELSDVSMVGSEVRELIRCESVLWADGVIAVTAEGYPP